MLITPAYLETMSLYNKWQNENLYSICDEMGEDQLHVNRGMYFGSIFRTLNHIIQIDEAILDFITSERLLHLDLDTNPYPHYLDLKAARIKFDQRLLWEAKAYPQEWLDQIIEFWSERMKKVRRTPRSFYYIQMFNHQIHHRSQITSELYKMGIDYGITDLPYNPYFEN